MVCSFLKIYQTAEKVCILLYINYTSVKLIEQTKDKPQFGRRHLQQKIIIHNS